MLLLIRERELNKIFAHIKYSKHVVVARKYSFKGLNGPPRCPNETKFLCETYQGRGTLEFGSFLLSFSARYHTQNNKMER